MRRTSQLAHHASACAWREHRCFGPKCEAVVRPTRLFCETHFKQLPERIIVQLRDAYDKHPPFSGRPAQAFLEAAERAIGALA